MPTAPVHQGCAASQRDHLDSVELLLRQVLVEQQALGVAAAAHVDPDRRVAVPGNTRDGGARRAAAVPSRLR